LLPHGFVCLAMVQEANEGFQVIDIIELIKYGKDTAKIPGIINSLTKILEDESKPLDPYVLKYGKMEKSEIIVSGIPDIDPTSNRHCLGTFYRGKLYYENNEFKKCKPDLIRSLLMTVRAEDGFFATDEYREFDYLANYYLGVLSQKDDEHEEAVEYFESGVDDSLDCWQLTGF